MGKVTGFLEIQRQKPPARPIAERVRDWREVPLPYEASALKDQTARCMDCGIPFCHQGCPLGNLIPDWNDLVYRGRWRVAIDRLHATNNFPEFTGRLCPAPCEGACVLGINSSAVTIKSAEAAIIERAFDEGWIVAQPPAARTGKRIAVVGSGPAGLAAADQLNKAGHWVTVFERADRIGGLLRYGIPEFKLEKRWLERRLTLMREEGVIFRTGCHVGVNMEAGALQRDFDAVVLAGGSTVPRDLKVPGRELSGIHFAMEYLTAQNRACAATSVPPPPTSVPPAATSVPHRGAEMAAGTEVGAAGTEVGAAGTEVGAAGTEVPDALSARDKHVIIIGGGDTGADCLGTAHRQGARSVRQLELLQRPPDARAATNPWPTWPNIFRVSSAHEEGGERHYLMATERFSGTADGRVARLHARQVDTKDALEFDADLVLLAMGFVGPEPNGVLGGLGVALTERGTVARGANWMTNVPGVFAAGDMQRGQSLIVWAIADGRSCARGVDAYLMGNSALPAPVS